MPQRRRRAVLAAAVAILAAGCGNEEGDRPPRSGANGGIGPIAIAMGDILVRPASAIVPGPPAPHDTLHLVLARLTQELAPLDAWRQGAEAVLRADSGTVRADSALLRLRRTFQERVRQVATRFDSPAFQALAYPDGAEGRRRFATEPAKEAHADSLVRFLAARGIWSKRAEGDTYFEASDVSVLHWFGRFVTDPTQRFLRLWAPEQLAPVAGDAAILVPAGELAARIAAADRFLAGHPDAAARDLVAERRRWHLAVYLGGLPNTPAFDRRSGVLDPELRRSFEWFAAEHGKTESGRIVVEYLALLEANGYREGQQTKEFLERLR